GVLSLLEERLEGLAFHVGAKLFKLFVRQRDQILVSSSLGNRDLPCQDQCARHNRGESPVVAVHKLSFIKVEERSVARVVGPRVATRITRCPTSYCKYIRINQAFCDSSRVD